MSFGARLEIRQSQQLVMTPQLQQAIKLLQMSNLDLAEYVAQEIERNPLLEPASATPDERRGNEERSPDARETAEQPAPDDLTANLREDRLTKAEETFDNGLENLYADASTAERQRDAAEQAEASAWSSVGGGGSSSFEGGDYDFESNLVGDITLREHLLEQLTLAPVDATLRIIVAFLIEHIDSAGYLKIEDEAIAAQLGTTPARVEEAVALIQTFEPAGVGARTLGECLSLQLLERNRLDPAMVALLDNLEMLAKAEFSKLAKLCGVDAEDMRDMVSEIRDLDPKPGTRFESDIAQTLVPDVYVAESASGGWSVELNSETLPRVLVNTRYAAKIDAKGDVKAYLTDCLQTANWLSKSLDQRARTILKVSSEIVRQQDGFLAHGVSELRPLNLKTVADAIEMHESTVSRVTSNKYIATPRGVFELKFFFTAAIASTDGGESYSAESIRHKIKKLIDDEEPKKILSDDKIVTILRGEGVDIARRTVAKYRESMNIPSSVQRRRRKAELV